MKRFRRNKVRKNIKIRRSPDPLFMQSKRSIIMDWIHLSDRLEVYRFLGYPPTFQFSPPLYSSGPIVVFAFFKNCVYIGNKRRMKVSGPTYLMTKAVILSIDKNVNYSITNR